MSSCALGCEDGWLPCLYCTNGRVEVCRTFDRESCGCALHEDLPCGECMSKGGTVCPCSDAALEAEAELEAT